MGWGVTLSAGRHTSVASTSSGVGRRLTVRSLLEGRELADIATGNIFAMGGQEAESIGWDKVRAQVSRNLKNISDMIHAKAPEAHAKMNVLELTDAQKEKALRVLHKYRESKVVRLAHA